MSPIEKESLSTLVAILFGNQDLPIKIWKSRNKFVSLHPIGNEGNKSMATDKVAYWLDIADYDLDTAEAMYQTGRWLYVAFMCHQTIEKTIKAYWCGTQTTDPLLMKLRNYNNG